MADNERPRSPINGQPLPEGKPWKTREEASEAGKKGGVRSGEVRRARRTLREELNELLAETITDKTGRQILTQRAISASMIKQALFGSTKAFELIRDTVGEKPVDKIILSEVDPAVINEVEAIVKGEAFGNAAAGAKDMTGKILKIEPESGKIENTYKTAAQAARENGIDPSNLAKAIKSGKTIGGFRWEKRKN